MGQDIIVLIEHIRGRVADISYLMLAQAKQLSGPMGGRVVALLLGSRVQHLAADLSADEVWYMDSPALAEYTGEAYGKALTPIFQVHQPKLALFGDTTFGSEIAGLLSVRLKLPLISGVSKLRSEPGCVTYVSQLYGGKMLVEGTIPGDALILMIPGALRVEQGRSASPAPVKEIAAPDLNGLRVAVKRYIDPEVGDVDITRENMLVGIGRGIQREDNMELANDLADALGAAVCATRPVVDQNWLPTTRLVGKSGKAIKPKVYLAMGISGAPEHVEAVTGSEMIIAVNTDLAAPIFNVARYGAMIDLLDLLPVLTEKVRQAKGS
jgi:electron transfer flavoprotein alpha subunit